MTLTALQQVSTTTAALADASAAQAAFVDYRSRKSNNTLRRQDTELATFATFLGRRSLSAESSTESYRQSPHSRRYDATLMM
jgi:uncharacterized protein with von Willebrand factor type A (vWA) domain